jgi:hypothetical protein
MVWNWVLGQRGAFAIGYFVLGLADHKFVLCAYVMSICRLKGDKILTLGFAQTPKIALHSTRIPHNQR